MAKKEEEKLPTEYIRLRYFHDAKKDDLQLGKVQVWQINNMLVGDCASAEPVERLTSAVNLDQKYEMAGRSKPELPMLLDAAIECDDKGLMEGVPKLP